MDDELQQHIITVKLILFYNSLINERIDNSQNAVILYRMYRLRYTLFVLSTKVGGA